MIGWEGGAKEVIMEVLAAGIPFSGPDWIGFNTLFAPSFAGLGLCNGFPVCPKADMEKKQVITKKYFMVDNCINKWLIIMDDLLEVIGNSICCKERFGEPFLFYWRICNGSFASLNLHNLM